MRFRFIDAERAGLAMPIFRLCRLLQVSVSGFYAWRNRGPSQRQLDDMVLLAHVRAAFRRSRESYGAERVHHELAENGIEVGRHRVARLMRGNGLSPKRKQKFKKTTDSQHNKAVASNLLDQNFSTEAPNEKWAADISYIWTAQGWLYLAVMLDLYSRRVIGWAVGARMTCPSYKFRPAQKSRPFRVVPDSVCDPHTILLHGVLSDFRSRAMRQPEIIAPRHQLDVLRRNQRSQSLERPKHQDFCAGRNL